MKADVKLTLQQQMQCRRSMCQQRCRQMRISNCIKADKVNSYVKGIDH